MVIHCGGCDAVLESLTMQRTYKKQPNSFLKDKIVQVNKGGEWQNYSLPCTSKLATDLAVMIERLYGVGNVRVVSKTD